MIGLVELVSLIFLLLRFGGEQMNLRQQTRKILDEIGIPVSVFCRKMQISDTAFYRWQKMDLKLSAETENRIQNYINQFSNII